MKNDNVQSSLGALQASFEKGATGGKTFTRRRLSGKLATSSSNSALKPTNSATKVEEAPKQEAAEVQQIIDDQDANQVQEDVNEDQVQPVEDVQEEK
jgi:hypothetical protein